MDVPAVLTAAGPIERVAVPSVHDFTVTAADGRQVPLTEYKGQVLLIVNVASKCGLTPQYEGLESLYRAKAPLGLQLLGFPCNQFKGQEPGTDADIQAFCSTTYDVTFPVFAKIDVNGPDADPLYEYLRSEAPGDFGPSYGSFYDSISKIRPDAVGTDEVKWNFSKFLVGRDGTVIKRYEPPVLPDAIATDLDNYL
ncbi:MAG: glutathione peroxidase [Actinomycetota bacterium]|nr:MAG: glutathione peroxidase [Actinomycetota bacterium]